MKQIKVAVRKKGAKGAEVLDKSQVELKNILEGFQKKGLNRMQMCHKLIEHGVAPPEGGEWSYDRVLEECERFKIPKP